MILKHTPFSLGLLRSGRWSVTAALCVILAFLACPAQGAVTVAGGQIIPVSAPGTGYVNDNNHPFPFMVFLPNGYSTSSGSYPLVFCLHGNGEVGNGSSNGTLTASTTNQLAYVFGSGPLPLIRNGSSYFGDKGVIVVQPQSDLAGGAAFNSQRVDLTMRHLLSTYRIDHNRIYTMGLSAGGGGVVRYAYNYGKTATYQLAAIVPFANIAGLGTTYTDFTKFAGSITWFINCSDDSIAPVILGTGRIWSGYGEGFAGGISRYIEQAAKGGAVPASTIKNRCLTTHPDLAAIAAGGFNTKGTIPATQLSDTYTGSFDPASASGWTWVPGQTFAAGSRLQITIRKGGGHSGWSQTMGSGSTPNLPFWDWLLAQRLGQTPTGYGAKSASVATGVTLTPTAVTLTVGQTKQFTAVAVDAAGVAVSPQPSITWASGIGGTITTAGLFTATTATSAVTVTATIAGTNLSRTATVTVNATATATGSLRSRPVDWTTPRPPYGYVEYLPAGYDPAGSKVWPLVIYLPNISEAGDGTDTTANGHQLYTKMVKHGPLRQVNSQHWDFPAIIIAPQVTTNWAKPLNVKNVVEYAKANYRVDINRIYMTGQLEGANGALRYAVAYPNDLAAILPIEASAPVSVAQATAIKDLPMWAVHGFADPAVARTISIDWIDAAATALDGGASDSMATYPGYGGSRNRFAVDCDASGKPLNPAGDITTIPSASLVAGSATVTFASGIRFGSNMFAMWGGSDAQPFARVTVAGESGVGTSAHGYPSSLTLTAARSGPTKSATVTIQTPVGYTATAYRASNDTWAWKRHQLWTGVEPDQHVLTLYPDQAAEIGWLTTWANWNVWNWMFSQMHAPSASG